MEFELQSKLKFTFFKEGNRCYWRRITVVPCSNENFSFKSTILQWFGQMTPWCFFYFWEMAFKVLGGSLAKWLLGVGVIWTKDSLVPGLSPDHPNTKESFGQITPQNIRGHFPKIKKHQGVFCPDHCRTDSRFSRAPKWNSISQETVAIIHAHQFHQLVAWSVWFCGEQNRTCIDIVSISWYHFVWGHLCFLTGTRKVWLILYYLHWLRCWQHLKGGWCRVLLLALSSSDPGVSLQQSLRPW